jgi:polynucleotide 5'-hydroxyl-kinase GRC3/NOL9
MTAPAVAALAAAARVRVSVIVGAGDTGKTSLAAGLAGALAAGGARVAVVDADVGQSEIGPPTTVGLGAVTGPLARLRDARVLALAFIGDVSPVRHIAETAEAAGRLVRRALAEDFTHVLVDTGGLVEGALGLALKRAKVRAVDPDLVLVVERRGESEPLARALGGGARPTVVRVPASPAVLRRTAAERRRHRDAALRDYLAAAEAVEVALERVRAGRGVPAAPAAGQLVGVYGDDEEALGLGRVQSVDPARRRIVIATPVEAARVATVRLGRAVWPAAT